MNNDKGRDDGTKGGSTSLAGKAGKLLVVGSVVLFIMGLILSGAVQQVGAFLMLSSFIALPGGLVLLLVRGCERITGELYTTGAKKILIVLALPAILLMVGPFIPRVPEPDGRPATAVPVPSRNSSAEIIHTVTCERVMLLDNPTGMMTCRGAIANVSGRTLQNVFIRLDYGGAGVSGWEYQDAELRSGAVREINVLDNWHRGQPDVLAKESGVGVLGGDRELESLMAAVHAVGGGEIPAAYYRLLEDIQSRGR